MVDQMEVPPVTRREREIGLRLDLREKLDQGVTGLLRCDSDIRYLLDVVALLRADLQVAVTRGTVWRRYGQQQASRADYLASEAVANASVG